MKPIETMNQRVQECIKKRGFTVLSDAQKQAIPLILNGNHVLLIAPTGTGKTESAMFPVFNESAFNAFGRRDQSAVHNPVTLTQPGYSGAYAVVVL